MTDERRVAQLPQRATGARDCAAGQLLGLKLLNYNYEPTRACMENVLRSGRFPRNGTNTVRVSVTLRD